MFEFLENNETINISGEAASHAVTLGSHERDRIRREDWFYAVSFLPIVRYRFWWLIHNCIVHPVLGLLPIRLLVCCHDWTGYKLNKLNNIPHSPSPVIKNRLSWLVHNCIAHMLIGLFPCETTFKFHDDTAKRMEIDGWV